MSYPIGSIISRARNSSLSSASQIWVGFLLCDGSTYLKSDYEDLYTKFSDNGINTDTNGYGVSSSDSTKFKVPKLSDYSPCMVNSQNTSGQLGATSGNLETTLDKYLLPSHSHSFSIDGSHAHAFIYKGFNQGYKNNTEAHTADLANTQYPVVDTTITDFDKIITIPTGLSDVIGLEITYQVGQSGTTSSSQINLDIINSYVGVDYYIKY
jgi:microcystin-dependent protein